MPKRNEISLKSKIFYAKIETIAILLKYDRNLFL